jgi:hypothetical protein
MSTSDTTATASLSTLDRAHAALRAVGWDPHAGDESSLIYAIRADGDVQLDLGVIRCEAAAVGAVAEMTGIGDRWIDDHGRAWLFARVSVGQAGTLDTLPTQYEPSVIEACGDVMYYHADGSPSRRLCGGCSALVDVVDDDDRITGSRLARPEGCGDYWSV